MAQTADTRGPSDPPGVRLGVVRGVSYGLFGKPDAFIPQARALGARLIRAYVYWGQVEPHPGHYTWDTVDAMLRQLDGDEEAWITVCSSSPWATRQPTDFLPPSPARDPGAYAELVRRLVGHCAGRVSYWQCDNEPSNTGLLWAGTAAEYVAQLRVMYDAVKGADPAAAVVLGGCGYDVFGSPAGSASRRFFDHLVSAGRDAFDLFDAHLYGVPERIPEYLETARQLMRAHGYLKPIVVGEYSGPSPFEFPDVEAVMREVLAGAFAAPPASQSTEALKAEVGQETPERRAMAALYARMPELPPRLQMFMAGCPPGLEAKRHRISCRQLVTRNILALADGIRRTAYWSLAPEVPGPADPYLVMHLLVGKLPLLDYRGETLDHRHPAANTFALLAGQLAGVEHVTRAESAAGPSVRAFWVHRGGREPLLVLWDERDPFDGEDDPPTAVTWPWPAPAATAVDALGNPHPTEVRAGRLRLHLSLTPVLVAPRPSGRP
jgi:hypothetical protein